LLVSWPAASSVAPAVLGRVLAKAEGNPFFLEELLFHVASGASTALPDSLHSLLAARLDALARSDLAVVQAAAVVGRTFWAEAVARGAPSEPVAQALNRLEARGFVVRQPRSSLAGHAEFMFRHALLHDVAYESLPRTRRATLHAAVAEWLEDVAGGARDQIEELLAGHWAWAAAPDVADLAWEDPREREEVRRRAFRHLVRAGASARARFALATALDLHQQALAIAATVDERIQGFEELGSDHDSAYDGNQAQLAYEAALELVRSTGSHPDVRARLCWRLAWMMTIKSGAFHVTPVPAQVEALIAEGMEAATDDEARAWLLLVEGACARLYAGNEMFGHGSVRDPRPIDERVEAVKQALGIAQALGLESLITSAREALGILFGMAGSYADGLALWRHQVHELSPINQRLARAAALWHLAVQLVEVSAGFEEALPLARESLELSRETHPHRLMHATYPILAALFHLGRWGELLEVLEEHMAAFDREPVRGCWLVRDGPMIGASVLILMGRGEEAQGLVSLFGDPLGDPETSAWQARCALIAGDPETARAICAEKAAAEGACGPRLALAQVEAHIAMEDWTAVSRCLPAARSLVPGNALLGPVCDRAEGLLEVARGRRTRARGLLWRALRGFETLEVRYDAARTRELLAAVEPAPMAGDLLAAAREQYAGLGLAVSSTADRSKAR
jgi:tetratricopeptide (TPR) repeat protein